MTGWFDCELARTNPASTPRHWRSEADQRTTVDAAGFQVELLSDRCAVHIGNGSVTLVIGEACDEASRPITAADVALLVSESKSGSVWHLLRGRFAVVHMDLKQCICTLVTDRFAVLPLCCSIEQSRISFSDRADCVPHVHQRKIDPQAVFDYVYFHVVPAPRTIFRGVQRLEAATQLSFGSDGPRLSPTWRHASTAKQDFDPKAEGERFRTLLRQSIERQVTTRRIGAFLSGGTDSSTVVGMLGQVTGESVDSFSIGFDASGYDEMSYARLAARHFNSRLHEHYVTPDELMRAIPLVAAHYDQPFGNSSALPAYYCSLLARQHGVDKLLAGDGGDELFGGNTRYARQKVFHAYQALPALLREHVIEPLLLRPAVAHRVPGVKKLVRYVEQARLRMPERMESYNLLFRFGASAVFTPEFLERVNTGEPSALQLDVYQRSAAHSIVDQMLAYDWRFTLTDSDLPKVRMTADLAGRAVGFPLLDDDLVDFSLALPASMKVHRLTLRYFFKRALRDFLPDAIIRKKKHGFGLPFGPWLVQHKPLARFASTSLERLVERGFIRRELVHDLFSARLTEHPGFYGEMVWVLMMLEYWLERHTPAFKLD